MYKKQADATAYKQAITKNNIPVQKIIWESVA